MGPSKLQRELVRARREEANMKHHDQSLQTLREWRDNNRKAAEGDLLYTSIEWSFADYLLTQVEILKTLVEGKGKG